jgi:hypothetical protein
MAKVVEHLPSKYEALCSILRRPKKKQREKKEKRNGGRRKEHVVCFLMAIWSVTLSLILLVSERLHL